MLVNKLSSVALVILVIVVGAKWTLFSNTATESESEEEFGRVQK
jgi:hypothetical protein